MWPRHGCVVLTPCSDLSAADWIAASEIQWQQLVRFGPAGFPAYARLRFLPDPAYEGQSENDVNVGGDAPTETARLCAVLETLTVHTRTPDDCYFCLWDGWGDIEGGGGARILDSHRGVVRRGPQIAPAFPPSVLHGPKVVVPSRAYFLFRGSVSDFGDWGQPRCGRVSPGCICPTPRSSGQPTTPGVSPTTSTLIGPGSEPIALPSTSFWLIHASASRRPTHAMSSRITGRQHKGTELARKPRSSPGALPTTSRVGTPALPEPAPERPLLTRGALSCRRTVKEPTSLG